MEFAGRLAVVTGGGSGMGRELVVQLAAEGCSVATCDVNEDAAEETRQLAEKGAPDGVVVTAHVCDVSDERAVERFRDEVVEQHGTDRINLLFNNAGVGGGGSFVAVLGDYAKRRGITYDALKEIGVATVVLRRAGMRGGAAS